MNKAQKIVISISLPLLAIFIGFELIGSSGSLEARNIGGITGQIFNPIRYFSLHGYQWGAVVVVTAIIELFLWRAPKIDSN